MSYDYPANTWGKFGVISRRAEREKSGCARAAAFSFSYSHFLPIFRDLLGNLVLPSKRRIDLLTLTKVN